MVECSAASNIIRCLFRRHPSLVALTHFPIQECPVIPHLTDPFFVCDRSMTWHNTIDVHLQDLIKRDKPIFKGTRPQDRRHPRPEDITSIERFRIWHIDEHISSRMRWSHFNHLYFTSTYL